jgi:E3 ubiquitin-protein ligase SHPRH
MWMALRERVCAIDEINMATMRMRLRHENEPLSDPPQANVVEPAEVCLAIGFAIIRLF